MASIEKKIQFGGWNKKHWKEIRYMIKRRWKKEELKNESKQTHYENDGCGESEHNLVNTKKIYNCHLGIFHEMGCPHEERQMFEKNLSS